MTSDQRVTSVGIRASDLSASAKFYGVVLGEDLGPPHTHDGGEGLHHDLAWGSFEDDTWFLMDISQAEGEPTRGVRVGFRVPDLAAVHDRVVAAGYPVIQEPHDAPWGRNAKYSDPDGNVVSVTQA